MKGESISNVNVPNEEMKYRMDKAVLEGRARCRVLILVFATISIHFRIKKNREEWKKSL